MPMIYRAKRARAAATNIAASKSEAAKVREKIFAALNNPTYRSRTLVGIAQEANLKPAVVLRAIQRDKTLAHVVKIVPMRSQDGRLLLTTKSRFWKEASLTERFVDFFASKRPEVADAK